MDRKKSIGFEVKSLSNVIKRRIDKQIADGCGGGSSVTHGWVIRYIYDNMEKGDVFQRDLEARFNIRRSTATGILKLMEKNGLIVREPVEYDARLKKLVLTSKAVELHESIVREINLIENTMRQGLSQEELDSFFATIEKIKSNVDK
jgi:DNA-binding MarR family transcriptional regulator